MQTNAVCNFCLKDKNALTLFSKHISELPYWALKIKEWMHWMDLSEAKLETLTRCCIPVFLKEFYDIELIIAYIKPADILVHVCRVLGVAPPQLLHDYWDKLRNAFRQRTQYFASISRDEKNTDVLRVIQPELGVLNLEGWRFYDAELQANIMKLASVRFLEFMKLTMQDTGCRQSVPGPVSWERYGRLL